MLKKYYKMIPYLLVAYIALATFMFLDAHVARNMMLLLDYALVGDIEKVINEAPKLMIQSLFLIPLGIALACANNYYKKKANVNLKTYYIHRVFQKNISEFQKENNAKYVSSITNDYNTLELNLIQSIYSIGDCAIGFLVGFWLLSTVDSRLILFAIIILVCNLGISYVTSKPSKKAFAERSDLFDGYTSYIKEVLSAFHIVKNYNLHEKVRNDYYDKSEAIQNKGFFIETLFTFITTCENFIANGSFYIILCVVGYMAVQGKITPGGVLIVVEGINRMSWPLFELGETMPKLFSTKKLIQKIEDTLKNSNEYIETISLPEFKDKIELEQVGFSYDQENCVLSDVNLTVKKNGKYLIIGPSGGGKSTLLRLFRKYFPPTKGTIRIDGYNLNDIKKEDYFALVANIEQQVFVFEDTIKNNITLYKEYPEEEIKKAIKDAGLTDFIKDLPKGLDTVILDNGKNISGGEKSRLVIARALLNKASILFMDEAFASLDMERAKEIEKTILSLEDITVINVSHVIFQETKDKYDKVITIKKTVINHSIL